MYLLLHGGSIALRQPNLCSSAVSDDNRAMAACSARRISSEFTTGVSVGLNAWHIMSGPGTVHTSHWDANGLMTIITVREGFKVWVWGRGKDTCDPEVPLVPAPGDREDWHWDLFANHDIYVFVLGPGDSG
jgi:hypothetical protein